MKSWETSIAQRDRAAGWKTSWGGQWQRSVIPIFFLIIIPGSFINHTILLKLICKMQMTANPYRCGETEMR